MSTTRTAVIIVAAGRGSRAGAGVPKQFRPLPDGHGETVLAATINAFATHAAIDEIMTVLHQDDLEFYHKSVNGLNKNDQLRFTFGGEQRQDSVLKGLRALEDTPPTHVLIHDAARPYVSHRLIDDCLAALAESEAAIAALPVTDTLKSAENGIITATVPRDDLYRAQTPQAFAYRAILAAHENAPDGLTDDAAVAEAAGLSVSLVTGEAQNIKLTHEDDFMSTSLLPRTGSGFDVHRFDATGSATAIMLGGIAIPHDRALIGHSDADVALHAITDALLGGLADGDIGDHFPPSDAANKDRPSAEFLHFAVMQAADKQARISHIDLTLICEAPKIGPHRDAMRAKIGEICGLPISRVAVKATTTEGLGFTGRGEGIAAQAIVTLVMPENA